MTGASRVESTLSSVTPHAAGGDAGCSKRHWSSLAIARLAGCATLGRRRYVTEEARPRLCLVRYAKAVGGRSGPQWPGVLPGQVGGLRSASMPPLFSAGASPAYAPPQPPAARGRPRPPAGVTGGKGRRPLHYLTKSMCVNVTAGRSSLRWSLRSSLPRAAYGRTGGQLRWPDLRPTAATVFAASLNAASGQPPMGGARILLPQPPPGGNPTAAIAVFRSGNDIKRAKEAPVGPLRGPQVASFPSGEPRCHPPALEKPLDSVPPS